MPKHILLTVAAGALLLPACTTTGNTERGAVTGAAAGAVIGAIIGNNTGSGDASTGAAIGAVVGGAGGAYAGAQKDKNTEVRRRHTNGATLFFDDNTGRYFWIDGKTGKSYYENGDFRG